MYRKNKNIYYSSLFLFLGLFLYISCVDDVIVHPDTSEQSYLSVREAKSFFESNYTSSYSRNASTPNDSDRLSPGNFTPLWEKSFVGSNNHVGSVEVPISSSSATCTMTINTGKTIPAMDAMSRSFIT